MFANLEVPIFDAQPEVKLYVLKQEPDVKDFHTFTHYTCTDPAYPPSIDKFKDEIRGYKCKSVCFRHMIRYISNGVEIDETNILTWNTAKHNIDFFINNIHEMKYKELWGDTYETYDNYILLADTVLTDYFYTIEENEGKGSIEIISTVNINDTTYAIRSARNPTEGECFFDILREHKDEKSIDELIKHLGLKRNNCPMSYENVKKLEAFFEILKIKIVTPEFTIGSGQIIECLLYKSHWWIIEDSVPQNHKPMKMNSKIIAYDMETVCDEPYMFQTYCPELGSKVIQTLQPGCTEFNHEVVNHLKYLEQQGYSCIGYNSSRYDDHFLLRIFNSTEHCNVTKGKGFSILNFSYKRMHFYDVCKFLNMTLKQACTIMEVELGKLDNDHKKIKDQYMRDKRLVITTDMLRYGIRDVECLYEMWAKAKQMFSDLGFNTDHCISIAQMVWRKFKKLNPNVPQLPEEYRKYITGGYCHGIPGIHLADNISCIDYCSLYPHVCMTETFISEGSQLEETLEIEDLGLYDVIVTKQPRFPVIVYKVEGETNDWNHEAPYPAFVTGIVANDHIRHGGELKVIRGQRFKHAIYSTSMFDFLKDLKKLKDISQGPKRALIKLLMNALSGKLTQLEIKYKVKLTKNEPAKGYDETKLLTGRNDTSIMKYGDIWASMILKNKTTKTGSNINGAFVYDYGKRILFNKMYTLKNVLYGDTDSIFTTDIIVPEPNWTLEHSNCESLVVGGKKMYTLFKNNNKDI